MHTLNKRLRRKSYIAFVQRKANRENKKEGNQHDQHGTAVVVAAGIENALDIVKKKLEDVKIIMNGAGAAGIACLEILKSMVHKSSQKTKKR